MADEVKPAEVKQVEPTYTREALAGSKKYRDKCDIVMIALDSDKEHTIAEADKAIKTFLDKPIKEKINGKKDGDK